MADKEGTARGETGDNEEDEKKGKRTSAEDQDKVDDEMKRLPGESMEEYMKRIQQKYGK